MPILEGDLAQAQGVATSLNEAVGVLARLQSCATVDSHQDHLNTLLGFPVALKRIENING